jgi:predicted Fe-S protein YdhL (DUF1289 family)
MAMDYPEVWKWDDMDDSARKEAYRNLKKAYDDSVKVQSAFVKLANRLADY